MSCLKLWFRSALGDPQLDRAAFSHKLLNDPGTRVSMRGRTPGVLPQRTGNFLWSNGVRAMCLLFVQTQLAECQQQECKNGARFLPYLEGDRLSPASSLDLALSKTPLWLQDLFGLDSRNHSIAHRMFRRSNPELKRPGPVLVSLNQEFLPSSSVVIFVNGVIASLTELRSLHRALTAQFGTCAAQEGLEILTSQLHPEQEKTTLGVYPTQFEAVASWQQIIFESTADSLAAFECLEGHIDAMHDKIYEGYPVVAYAELGRLRDIALNLSPGQMKRAARAVARANWMRIRCLSDLTKTYSFGSAVRESEEAVAFADGFKCDDRGATYWTNAAIRRLEFLAWPSSNRPRKMLTQCIAIAERALQLIPFDRPGEKVVAHLELAKIALITNNRRLFEQQTDRAHFFGARVAQRSRYLLSLVWDVRARGSLRFDSNVQCAIENLEIAKKVLSENELACNHRAIKLYIGNTEIQAFKTFKDPVHAEYCKRLEHKIALEAMILGNPYQAQRLKQESLTGL